MKNPILSPAKANSLFWLGRYTERVYLQLHLLRRCLDQMIDDNSKEYDLYLYNIGNQTPYPNMAEERRGLVYDKKNPASIISCVERANDNAVILRDEITSPTLGYVQMSLEFLRDNSRKGVDSSVEDLQKLTDWMLAFWGSVDERIFSGNVRSLLMIGKLIEHIDMYIRFKYPFDRIEEAFLLLESHCRLNEKICNIDDLQALKMQITPELYNPDDIAYTNKVLNMLGSLIIAGK